MNKSMVSLRLHFHYSHNIATYVEYFCIFIDGYSQVFWIDREQRDVTNIKACLLNEAHTESKQAPVHPVVRQIASPDSWLWFSESHAPWPLFTFLPQTGRLLPLSTWADPLQPQLPPSNVTYPPLSTVCWAPLSHNTKGIRCITGAALGFAQRRTFREFLHVD